jgi:pimeloyl-ACP methyl ester carboxylesterase
MSYADVNGISLYYEEHGSGRPLILLHGGYGRGTAAPRTWTARCASRRWAMTSPRSRGTWAWRRLT